MVEPTRERIERLLSEGLGISEIGRRLGLAGPTVAYHAERLSREADLPEAKSRAAVPAPSKVRREIRTRAAVEELLAAGAGRGEIARALGLSKSTVSYHARRLGAPVDARGARRYDWAAVQEYYDGGHSVRQCQPHFGFSRQTWSAAVKREAVIPRPHRMPPEELFLAGVHRGRHNLKRRLVESGARRNACESCGISDWLGKPITFALHHATATGWTTGLRTSSCCARTVTRKPITSQDASVRLDLPCSRFNRRLNVRANLAPGGITWRTLGTGAS